MATAAPDFTCSEFTDCSWTGTFTSHDFSTKTNEYPDTVKRNAYMKWRVGGGEEERELITIDGWRQTAGDVPPPSPTSVRKVCIYYAMFQRVSAVHCGYIQGVKGLIEMYSIYGNLSCMIGSLYTYISLLTYLLTYLFHGAQSFLRI